MNRAEKGGDAATNSEENLPSVEDLTSNRLELEDRIEQAQKERKKNLEKRVGDREKLIGEAKEADNLLTEVQKTIDQYNQADKDDLLDDQSKEEFEKYKQLQQKLKEQLAQINKKIDQLSAQPDVLETIHGEAHKENAEKKKDEIIEQTVDKYKPEVEALLRDMEEYAGELSQTAEERDNWQRQHEEAFGPFKIKLNKLITDLNLDLYERPGDFSEAKIALEKAKAKLSAFSFGKKKAIKQLLESEDFTKGSAIEKQYYSTNGKYNKLWGSEESRKIFEDYFQRSRQIQKEAINFGLESAQSSGYPELTTDQGNINRLQSNISHELWKAEKGDEIIEKLTKSGEENKLKWFKAVMKSYDYAADEYYRNLDKQKK